MTIEKIHINELVAFVNSAAYQSMPVVPISKHRAISHAKNPRAKSDDLSLVLIYEGELMVAYLGVLPDDLYVEDEVHHVGWLSCMWVDPNMRGKGLSKKLIKTVFEAWDYKILVTEFTPSAHGLYKSTKEFIDLRINQGYRYYRRANFSYLLPKKDGKWNAYKPLLKLGDRTVNLALSIKSFFQRKEPIDFQQYIVDSNNGMIDQVMKKYADNAVFKRTQNEVRWAVDYPWLLTDPQDDPYADRYHFSSIVESFNHEIYVLNPEKGTDACLICVTLRKGNMKVPYCLGIEGNEDILCSFFNWFLIKNNVNTLTLFNEMLVRSLSPLRSRFFSIRPFRRHYIINKQFEGKMGLLDELLIHDGDGDAIFT